MRCPVDNETLVMADRGGVEIDYCPKCRGVWLDRGELDKIIERAAAEAPEPAASPQAPPRQAPPRQAAPGQAAPIYQPEPQRPAPHGYAPEPRRYDYDDDDDDYHRGYKKRRKKSLLGEIFDF
ncbi:zf-TFIIB domain-containing protein [Tabrizicola sp.]|uniref:TFIIB-type zinc ribbon-containing protein n=1 Tax=Tabrizicola sp. TaxID=2005166 RepID=UPI003F2DE909